MHNLQLQQNFVKIQGIIDDADILKCSGFSFNGEHSLRIWESEYVLSFNSEMPVFGKVKCCFMYEDNA